ncbi:radical SAM family heme chaperone HemW [Anaerocolumna aminovalerica]|jgi:oxygen-independent coproporphyrinogen-3 oxidase|uniref:Heme chaperone HemW n=1 Tax=Anaerocolumna aminovalerica TaxID=1527 RepID=A0A1I5CYL7_9FIRM|nr:radical SAM family heme chaperone HemW [Anaerocolumna aminovalerica]MBU5331303.1 radical SAM family heme chaperone HemW [Anaerocolumna aminovalerica]MDU6264357.1 radical SAM family heme chaperone HemW [Anaerocolumna aminovalerica]SFN92058.1 oxygen-independent coproporphyrinogen-3 oxidase [Anaerocolumna aminovalerica]
MENKLIDSYKDLGLYIHIPFCVKKCDYCDFLSGPASEETKRLYVKALIKEILSNRDLASEYLVKTIFIGGGTPSSVDGRFIGDILEAVREVFPVSEKAEISIEANPGTLNEDKLKEYKKAGINRISFGLQSVDDRELKLLGRIHSYKEFEDNYLLARELGFQNINVDLISALPGQTMEQWLCTLEKVILLKPEHISAYSLILEEGTPFFERYSEEDQDEDLDRRIYGKTREVLEKAGYYRYEISNYARPGYACRHNSSYWTRTNYLGLGLGASSLFHNIRFHNEENMQLYIENSHNRKQIRKDIEYLDKNKQMEEFMFLGLRMTEGIHKNKFKDLFGEDIENIYGDVLKQSFEEGLLMEEHNHIFLTEKGLDLSNVVMARFLLDE